MVADCPPPDRSPAHLVLLPLVPCLLPAPQVQEPLPTVEAFLPQEKMLVEPVLEVVLEDTPPRPKCAGCLASFFCVSLDKLGTLQCPVWLLRLRAWLAPDLLHRIQPALEAVRGNPVGSNCPRRL